MFISPIMHVVLMWRGKRSYVDAVKRRISNVQLCKPVTYLILVLHTKSSSDVILSASFMIKKTPLPFFVKLNQVLIIVITLKTSSASYSWSKTQTKLMMLSFPRLITALLIRSLVVGGRADLIFLSLFLYSSFTTPSGLHRQKKNRLLLCGSCFNQLPDYSNKVGFISFAGLKLFPLHDKFISRASGFQPAKNVSNLKTTVS